jgi:hypothetical protein
MKSAQRAKVKSRAAMTALRCWSGHQEETRQDSRRAGMKKGSLSGREAAAFDANVDSGKRMAAA